MGNFPWWQPVLGQHKPTYTPPPHNRKVAHVFVPGHWLDALALSSILIFDLTLFHSSLMLLAILPTTLPDNSPGVCLSEEMHSVLWEFMFAYMRKHDFGFGYACFSRMGGIGF